MDCFALYLPRPLRYCLLSLAHPTHPLPPAVFARRPASFVGGAGWACRPAPSSLPGLSVGRGDVAPPPPRSLRPASRAALAFRGYGGAGGTGRGAGSLVRPRGPVVAAGLASSGPLSVRSAPPIFAPGPSYRMLKRRRARLERFALLVSHDSLGSLPASPVSPLGCRFPRSPLSLVGGVVVRVRVPPLR